MEFVMDLHISHVIFIIFAVPLPLAHGCPWSGWSSCEGTCGYGTRSRRKLCCSSGGAIPRIDLGDCDPEYSSCRLNDCKVNGKWGSWGSWSPCSVTCGQGTRQRTRACNNPPPSGGGLDCRASSTQTSQCSIQPVHGGWGTWGQYSSCSKSCGIGTRTRYRSCNNPTPAICGDPCPGSSSDSDDCNVNCCPVGGGWGSWGSWSSCSVSCGYGERIRHRTCNSPAPRCGGAFCTDKNWSTKQCYVQPVHGGWGQWGAFGQCSEECAGGDQARTRRCDSPTPAKCGNQCFGASTYSRKCNNQECPVDGTWNQWEPWSLCSVSCGKGTRTRYRNCSEPQYEGRDCPGNSTDSIQCIVETVDGGWGKWGEYSTCTVTCGGGIKTRHRSCSNPTPEYCGAPCSGNRSQNTDCSNADCQRKPHKDDQSLPDIEDHVTTQSHGSFAVNANKSIVANDTTIEQNKDDLNKELYVIIGACVGVVAIIAVIVIIVFSVRVKRNKMKEEDGIPSSSEATTYETPEFSTEVTGTESAYASLSKDGNAQVH